jgi:hypothetical protein
MLELAISLKKNGHDVTITTSLKDSMINKAKKFGIKAFLMQEPPGYKLGDGKWVLNTPNGPVTSKEKTLYKIQDINFDIIHVFNDELIEHYRNLYPDNALINTQYTDGLILNYNHDSRVDKTIKLNTNLDDINKKEVIETIVSEYIDTL